MVLDVIGVTGVVSPVLEVLLDLPPPVLLDVPLPVLLDVPPPQEVSITAVSRRVVVPINN
ncbi:MAG: hypothetical protein ACKPKW_26980 [Dolichospermum sp.]